MKCKEKMRKYNEVNSDKIKEYKQHYHQENKEKRRENMKTITCEICHGKFLQCNLSRHKVTLKHLIGQRLNNK